MKRSLVGSITFGLAIGIMTALARQNGSTTTLIGLLFALFGGSLVALVKPSSFTADDREWIMMMTGGISGGVIAGLLLGLGLIVFESAVILPARTKQQIEYLTKLKGVGVEFGTLEAKTVSSLVEQEPLIRVHSAKTVLTPGDVANVIKDAQGKEK